MIGRTNSPRRLTSTAHEKVWGAPETEPWARNPEGRRIGEIWFAASDEVPLLVKFLFTSDNLSVQVHPGDDYARKHHNSRGKTEMWHILRAEPGAKIALGLREQVTPDRLRAAAASGEIMELLNWIPARRGDTFFVPAGTIHAIGGGLALCEVQQHSDVTYRLYDYGRPRELHLDHSLAVSHLTPPKSGLVPLPVESPYFRTDRITVTDRLTVRKSARNTLYIALEGTGLLAGQPFRAGEAWESAADAEPFEITSENAAFLVTSPL
ncbi:MAG TPA: class I mannose-6-phosphate isomerase [Bryobacteraceae bacterium]